MEMTEAEWIRSMNDEQLAHYISRGRVCLYCPAKELSCFGQRRSCNEAWIHHLRQKRKGTKARDSLELNRFDLLVTYSLISAFVISVIIAFLLLMAK